jgi:hypothetical protein
MNVVKKRSTPGLDMAADAPEQVEQDQAGRENEPKSVWVASPPLLGLSQGLTAQVGVSLRPVQRKHQSDVDAHVTRLAGRGGSSLVPDRHGVGRGGERDRLGLLDLVGGPDDLSFRSSDGSDGVGVSSRGGGDEGERGGRGLEPERGRGEGTSVSRG